MPRPWWPTEAASAVRIALTCVAAIYLAMLLELDRPEWAGWTVLSVSLVTRASSLQKSLWRAVSSIIGCVIAVALTANFAQSTLAFDAAIALWLALLTAAASVERGQRSYGFALMGYTVPIVTLGEIETARRLGLTFTVIVVNNAASGYVKALQHLVYGAGSYHASDLSETNYAEAAKVLGCNGIRVEEPGQLAAALKQAMSLKGPTVVDVVVTRDPAKMLPGVDNRAATIRKGDRVA
jgi:hypothetical protein